MELGLLLTRIKEEPSLAGETCGLLRNDTVAYGVVVASCDKGRSCRRAKRRRMELRVA